MYFYNLKLLRNPHKQTHSLLSFLIGSWLMVLLWIVSNIHFAKTNRLCVLLLFTFHLDSLKKLSYFNSNIITKQPMNSLNIPISWETSRDFDHQRIKNPSVESICGLSKKYNGYYEDAEITSWSSRSCLKGLCTNYQY